MSYGGFGAVLAFALDRTSPQVTQWPQRLLLSVIVLLVVGLAVLGMWWGWRNRARRQGDIPAPTPTPTPDQLGPSLAEAEGRYVGTARAGDWLDRVVVHSLGVPSRAAMSVHREGVLFRRTGAPEIFIPAEDLVDVRSDRGAAGTVVERDGMLVLRWRLGSGDVETGFRGDQTVPHAAVLAAAAGLVPGGNPRSAAQAEGGPA